MSNTLKRMAKRKRKDFDFESLIPEGTMLESFKTFMLEESYSAQRVADFLDIQSAIVGQKIDNGHEFTEKELTEMLEFYEYFVENFADEDGCVDPEIAALFDDAPLVIDVIETFLEQAEMQAAEDFVNSTTDEQKEKATELAKKIFEIDGIIVLSGITKSGTISFGISGDMDEDELDERQADLMYTCLELVASGGMMIVSVIRESEEMVMDDEDDDEFDTETIQRVMTFGIVNTEEGGGIKAMDKEFLTEYLYTVEGGNIVMNEGEEVVDVKDMIDVDWL